MGQDQAQHSSQQNGDNCNGSREQRKDRSIASLFRERLLGDTPPVLFRIRERFDTVELNVTFPVERAMAGLPTLDLSDRLEQMARSDPSPTVARIARYYLGESSRLRTVGGP